MMIETVAETRTAICDKHGEYEFRVMNVMGKEIATKCPMCEAEAKEATASTAAKSEIDKAKEATQKMMQAVGIPRRYANATLASFEATNEKQAKAKRYSEAFVERFESCLEKGTSMVFCGKVGTGKTHLAYAIAREVHTRYSGKLIPAVTADNIHKSRPRVAAKVVSALDILREVKATFSKDSSLTELQVIEQYTLYPLLIIDEVGVQYGSEAEKVIMFDILNRRYLEMMPTILISNLPIAELTNFVGDRVIDRMKEGKGQVIDFDWESYRK